MSTTVEILRHTWELVLQSGPFLMLGFLLAGLLHTFLPVERVTRWLGGRRIGSVVRAAALGAPLPLCSCAVVPVAASLRKSGASKGATTAFLISTPETGVDSIALTYALMDPTMTIARPLTAVATAIAAGAAQNAFNRREDEALATDTATACCASSPADDPADSCCATTTQVGTSGRQANPPGRSPARLSARMIRALRFGLIEMFEDLAGYLVVGFLVAGVLSLLLQSFDFCAVLGSPWAPLGMLAAGIPLYVCASAATPMIAVLISQGLSPGAGLVFLLAGPATNAASLVVLHRVLGRRGVVVYLISIMLCAILAGYAIDGVYALSGLTPRALTSPDSAQGAVSWLNVSCAIALTVCVGFGLWRRYRRRMFARRQARVDQSLSEARSAD